jgi:uncharacterized protein
VVAFARVLRELGLDVTVESTRAYGEALVAAGLDRRSSVYWAGRATLVHNPEDVAMYDRAFVVFWEGWRGEASPMPPVTPLVVAHDDSAGESIEPRGDLVRAVRWSPTEVLRERDFA